MRQICWPSSEIHGLTDAACLLDEHARAAYRHRLDELRAELADREGRGASDGAEAIRTEIDSLAHELARAIGRGGRDRRSGAATERARINVTRAIHTAIRHIDKHLPELGYHFRQTIRTGSTCAYQPDPDETAKWD